MWGGSSLVNIAKIWMAQKHCIRVLFGDKKHGILALNNLYTYHTFMEVFKTLKLRCPISLYECFKVSSRKETTLITSFPSHDFISRGTVIWNTIAPKLKLLDYSHNISLAKSSLKRALLHLQHSGDNLTWTKNDSDITRLQNISSKRP